MAITWCRASIALFVLTSVLCPGVGERFFQYRDHRDQQLYEDQQKAVTVHNKMEAGQQLEKYGYLRCRMTQRHKRSGIPSDIFEGPEGQLSPSEGNLLPCSNREVRKAIKLYQKKYNLPPTGILDRETKRFMSASRCGNSDQEDKIVQVTEKINNPSSKEMLNKFVEDSAENSKGPDSWGNKFKSRPWKRSVSDTALMRVIRAGKQTSHSLETRRKYLHNYIDRLKREDPMMYKADSDSEQKLISVKKRSVAIVEHIENTTFSLPREIDGQKFEKQVIRWRLLETGYSSRIPVEDQRATIDLAFRMWSEVIPLKFVEEVDGDIAHVDIEVAFAKGAHQNCKRVFDGHGGEIAHSFSTGNMHFDDAEYFKSIRSVTSEGIYLLRVAVHEIGHVLGLMHTNKRYSIMYAIYEKENSGPEFELGWEDRKAVQQVYGVCKGRFNTVFDWLRKGEDGQFIYNTYFFRGNHYWMYENHANRTRYGDPLYISREWEGIPNEPDGYAHVFFFHGVNLVDDAYFFKDDDVFKYNNDKDELYEGWPKKIRDVFGPKSDGGTVTVPDHIDTAFFDVRDKNLYFFKDDMVYVFDPKEPEDSRGCCTRVSKITDEFPVADGSTPLDPNLDAVYYSYKDWAQYFIKGEDVWQNVLYHPQQKHIKNSIKYIGKWYDKWFDICDVTTHATHMDDVNVT